MTILVAYAPRPEGEAALDKGIEIAKRRNERLMVVNASPGGGKSDPSAVDVEDAERVQKRLKDAGISAEFKQLVRGRSAVEEINDLVDATRASVLIIGIRPRSPIGKLILGSVAQELILTAACPVLAVKASH